MTLNGTGTMNTRPFHLNGGNYTINLEATNPPNGHGVACSHFGTLRSTAGRVVEHADGPPAGVPEATTRKGSTQAYNLAAGDYYMDMTSGCDWLVVISRLS